jgi:hypothetical protein
MTTKQALKHWVRQAHYAKDTQNRSALAVAREYIRRYWKQRHSKNVVVMGV